MQTQQRTFTPAHPFERACLRTLFQTTLAAALLLPGLAMAQVGGSSDALGTTCGFLGSILSILNAASIVVVTIAVIFSGYQIAFAHKRISDVAPIMIGAILIGAASQIAKMFLSGSAGGNACASSTSSIWTPAMDHLASAAQLLVQHA
ncbi:TrbC/VirB2 family protein [Variovorax sp. J22P240]|uniref:TrbC/VirB2 family protein n=1 Tax=Variovorax sp. J22P240 TaxID=3053514 RepID=UPI002574D006|nr:TrbC/VirB2 family protein [Variovorax sp. J22P240]MDL9998468.1 TrbC/VirB2 family protein [Variovorax sp. J22P240]